MSSTTHRWSGRHGLTRLSATVALVTVLASCGGTLVPDTGSGTRAEPPVFGGVMLDVWGGGDPSPGSTTTMFVHRGDRAAELYWTTGGWCLARVHRWALESVYSGRAFDAVYTVQQRFPDCMAGDESSVRFRVFDVHRIGGATVYVGADDEMWTERTLCGSVWGPAGPCGFPGAAAAVPPW